MGRGINKLVADFRNQTRIKEMQDALLHEINGVYYIEFVDGRISRINLATPQQTEALLEMAYSHPEPIDTREVR